MRYIILCLLLVGCSSTENQKADLVPEPNIVLNGDDTSYWEPTVKVAPVYPALMAQRGQMGCVNVSYVITSEGNIANPRVIKAYPESGFEKASIKAVMKFQYIPSVNNIDRVPIRTNNLFTYTIDTGFGSKKMEDINVFLHEKCQVDLTSLLKGTH